MSFPHWVAKWIQKCTLACHKNFNGGDESVVQNLGHAYLKLHNYDDALTFFSGAAVSVMCVSILLITGTRLRKF